MSIPAKRRTLRQRIWPARQPRTFISFEGIDGSGKSTIVERMEQHLRERKVPFATLQQAGKDTLPGRIARAYARQRKLRVTGPVILPLFSLHSRWSQVKKLGRGERVVLMDRSQFSFFAYMKALGVHHPRLIKAAWTGVHKPNVIVILDVDPEKAMQRVREGGRGQLDQHETLEKLRATRNAYVELAKRPISPFRNTHFIVVNANQPPNKIMEEVLRKLVDYGMHI